MWLEWSMTLAWVYHPPFLEKESSSSLTLVFQRVVLGKGLVL
jgi:hypothetical protein